MSWSLTLRAIPRSPLWDTQTECAMSMVSRIGVCMQLMNLIVMNNNNLIVDRTENYEMAERIVVDSKTNYPAGM